MTDLSMEFREEALILFIATGVAAAAAWRRRGVLLLKALR
jgi:hypothetical protein